MWEEKERKHWKLNQLMVLRYGWKVIFPPFIVIKQFV